MYFPEGKSMNQKEMKLLSWEIQNHFKLKKVHTHLNQSAGLWSDQDLRVNETLFFPHSDISVPIHLLHEETSGIRLISPPPISSHSFFHHSAVLSSIGGRILQKGFWSTQSLGKCCFLNYSSQNPIGHACLHRLPTQFKTLITQDPKSHVEFKWGEKPFAADGLSSVKGELMWWERWHQSPDHNTVS